MVDRIITSGKRKTSVARAVIVPGNGEIKINLSSYKNRPFFDRLKIEEPLKIAESILGKANFNISVTVHGGGEKSQTEASRLAIAKAIVAFSNSKELRDSYAAYDRTLLVADVRRKEACKPGDSKARSKRQTSYR